MKINSIQQQNYNNQSFSSLKMTPKAQAVCDKAVNEVLSNVKKVVKESKPSFWQRVKDAWNLANKLQ